MTLSHHKNSFRISYQFEALPEEVGREKSTRKGHILSQEEQLVSEAPRTLEPALQISIFGKPDCDLCKSTQRKVEFFLSKWNLRDQVKLRFHDLTTVEGLAEGAYYNATDIPTTLVLAGGQAVARWEVTIPPSEELRQALTES